MAYSKIGGKMGFSEDTHTYTHLDSGKQYTSVTTLIGKFKPKFDGEYWATYKALKDVLEEVDLWREYKRRAGGWENVVKYYKNNGYLALAEDIAKRKKEYLQKWARESEDACELGSAIHLELENAAFHSQHIKEEEINYKVTQEDILAIQDFNGNGYYPELLVYSDKYEVSGQIDGIYRKGKTLNLIDFKTCKNITKEPFRDETMLFPFTHISNANYWVYTLQLSIYAYMMEMLGFKIGSLEIHWLYGKGKDRSNLKTFKLPYFKEDAIKMLELNIK